MIRKLFKLAVAALAVVGGAGLVGSYQDRKNQRLDNVSDAFEPASTSTTN